MDFTCAAIFALFSCIGCICAAIFALSSCICCICALNCAMSASLVCAERSFAPRTVRPVTKLSNRTLFRRREVEG